MSLQESPEALRTRNLLEGDKAIEVARAGFLAQAAGVAEIGNSRTREAINWIGHWFSFWTVIPFVAVVSGIFFFFVLQPMYVSESFVSLRSKTQSGSSLGGLLGSLGTTTDTTLDSALINQIQSNEMLTRLDKKLHLRAIWSSNQTAYVSRLDTNASPEDFLKYYQGMINAQFLPDSSLIQIDVSGYDPKLSYALNQEIIKASEQFINTLSLNIQSNTLKFAEDELRSASKAVIVAQDPTDRGYAEARLSAAQSGLAAAAGVASSQQEFVEPVSGPSLPTETSLPQSLLDTIGTTLLAAILYIVGILMWSNVKDHRRV